MMKSKLEKHRLLLLPVCCLFLAALLLISPGGLAQTQPPDSIRISKPGEYAGYSRLIYDRWKRTSQYITVRDGTRLAVDIFRPTRNEQPVEEPLPVIWTYDRYHRADVQENRVVTQLDQDPWLRTVLGHGYIIGVVDVRGGGASYGTWEGPFTVKEATDGYDITEWFAAQSWCNKRVGMYGRSYLGITQYLTAAMAPPHLIAIFPEMAIFDLYSFAYGGGIFRNNYAANWERLVSDLDKARPAAPVDGDANGEGLAAAIKQHSANRDAYDLFAALPFRDSIDKTSSSKIYLDDNPARYVERIKKSRVAIYHLAGWNDMWPRDAFLWFNNLDNPQKIIVGPWSHNGSSGFDLAAEHLRWYDYWLKGINNGIMDEAPIRYYTMGAPAGDEWRTAAQWPLSNEQSTKYFFQRGPSRSVASVNDALLGTEKPASADGKDDYAVNYSTTSGTATRWANGYGGRFGYPDMVRNDEKGLTYTTPALTSDVEVTGHPVVHLFATTTAKDVDLFVYLEEVSEEGGSRYVTEGTLRASHRATYSPPFDNMKLPYHRSFVKDVVEVDSEPMELVIDLLPTSKIFKAGHRLRITITGADKDNYLTPEMASPPVFSILRNANHASYVSLPIVPAQTTTSKALGLNDQPTASSTSSGSLLPYILAAIALTLIACAVVYVKFNKSARRDIASSR